MDIVTDISNEEAHRRAEQIVGLRALASFLEAHADVPMPVLCGMNAFAEDKAQLARVARVAGWTKQYRDTWFTLSREFPGGVELEVNIERGAICRKVVTGTVVVPAQPEHEVEQYEWVCDEPSLLAGSR